MIFLGGDREDQKSCLKKKQHSARILTWSGKMEKCVFFKYLSFISPIWEIWPWKFFSFWLGAKDDIRNKNYDFLGIFGKNIGKSKSNFLYFSEKMEKRFFFQWCEICENQQNHEIFDFLKNGFPQLLVHKSDRCEVFGLFWDHFKGRRALLSHICSTCGFWVSKGKKS